MIYYTETIPVSLAEKLKEKGMPMKGWQGWATPYISVMEKSSYNWLDDEMGILEPQMVERRYSIPTYAEVFDWLMERGIDAEVALSMIIDVKNEGKKRVYFWTVGSLDNINYECGEDDNMTWHGAANAAIEKALELIK